MGSNHRRNVRSLPTWEGDPGAVRADTVSDMFGRGYAISSRRPDNRAMTSSARSLASSNRATGRRSRCSRRGPGAPLLLVHGTAGDHTTFRVVGPRLADDVRDLGDGPARARRVGRHAALLDRARIRGRGGQSPSGSRPRPVDPWRVFGHSYGGRCALGAALLTDAIDRVICYEGAPAPPDRSYHPTGFEERLRQRLEADGPAGVLATFMTEIVGMTASGAGRLSRQPRLARSGRRGRDDPARARGRSDAGRVPRRARARAPARPPAPRVGQPAGLPRRDARP